MDRKQSANTKPFPAAPPKPQPRKEDYVRHPEFAERIGKAMDGVEFPADKIPKNFGKWIGSCLAHVPFSQLGMPLPFYYDLINEPIEKLTFGVLQKACDIIYNSSPEWHDVPISEYYGIISAAAAMKDALSDITDPIRDKVIEDLMAKDKIKQSGIVTG